MKIDGAPLRVFLYEHLTALGTSDSSLASEGWAMFDAVRNDLLAIPGVEVLTIDQPGLIDGRVNPSFLALAAEADAALLIAPETDGILESLSQAVVAAGGRLIGPTPDAIQLTADKLRLAAHLRSANVPTPPTWEWGSEPEGLFPVVWKPRDGAGSQDTYLVRDSIAASALRGSIHTTGLIVQPYITGDPVSVAFILGSSGTLPLPISYQDLSTDGRFSYYGGALPFSAPPEARVVETALQAVRSVAGLQGYVGVDLVVGPAGTTVIEINPRMTTSYVGYRALALSNLAHAILLSSFGTDLPILQWREGGLAFRSNGIVNSVGLKPQ